MSDPSFWDDPDKANKIAKDVDSLKVEVEGFHQLCGSVDDLEALQEMAAEEQDESLIPEMDELLEKTFEGSIPAFMAAFVGNRTLSEKELREIRRLLGEAD